MTERKPSFRVVIIEWPKTGAWSWSIVDDANRYAICDAAFDSQSRAAAYAAYAAYNGAYVPALRDGADIIRARISWAAVEAALEAQR